MALHVNAKKAVRDKGGIRAISAASCTSDIVYTKNVNSGTAFVIPVLTVAAIRIQSADMSNAENAINHSMSDGCTRVATTCMELDEKIAEADSAMKMLVCIWSFGFLSSRYTRITRTGTMAQSARNPCHGSAVFSPNLDADTIAAKAMKAHTCPEVRKTLIPKHKKKIRSTQ